MSTDAKDKTYVCSDHPFSGGYFVPTPDRPPHWGKMVCPECNKNLGWVTKPENEKRNRRASKKLAKPFVDAGIDYCQICLRQRCELPPSMTFVAHHIVEVRDGGTDDPHNLLHLCTFCHELVHLLRRNRQAANNRPDVVNTWWTK